MTTVAEGTWNASRVLAEDIAAADMAVAVLEDEEATRHAEWQAAAAELELAVAEREHLRKQQGRLPFCDTCQNHHIPLSEPCPPPAGCADCDAEAGEPCRPGCLSRNEIDYGAALGSAGDGE